MKEVTKTFYEAFDGARFCDKNSCEIYESTLSGYFCCPMCDGAGTVNSEPIFEEVYSPEETGFLGQFANPVFIKRIKEFQKVHCQTCHGKGFTSRPLKPITKIVGYE